MLVLQLLKWCLEVAEVLIAVPTVYLCILVTMVILQTNKPKIECEDQVPTPESACINFGILIPAHNEEVLLGPLLKSLSTMTYPKDLYSVYVIADNCTDSTAQVARTAGGVQVYERFDQAKRSKGHALAWAFQQLKENQSIHDAYVIFDADSIIDSKFLQAMADELKQGKEALQGYYGVLNATESPSTILRWIALTLMNHMRPFGRSLLGFSTRLTGNGMCLSHDLLEHLPWCTYGHSEDYEYYLVLLQHGTKVHYVRKAIVHSHMPPTFADMRTQDIRWESGLSLKIEQTLSLLRAGFRLRAFDCFEEIIVLLTPPLSFIVGWCILLLAGSLLLWSPPDIVASLILMSGFVYYVGSAFLLLCL